MNQQVWWSSRGEVAAFARDLAKTGTIDTVDLMVDYIEKPWKWTLEYQWWMWNGRTDDAARWGDANDYNYQVDYDRV